MQACANDLAPHLNAGRLSLPVDSSYPLEAIAQAHAYMETDQHIGKILLTVDQASA
ncbi:zinc-binding dehydrogenase [Cupriavidus sp. TMH.W2]|uniref:zinc-binding dehydrogenase n=1 Tax=Cupriavidus sp. TMH.W2 TaxID=3434465 RepID=UPI003D76AE61